MIRKKSALASFNERAYLAWYAEQVQQRLIGTSLLDEAGTMLKMMYCNKSPKKCMEEKGRRRGRRRKRYRWVSIYSKF